MPREYAATFDDATIGQHAAIVLGRPPGRAFVRLCETCADGDSLLCVVAEDEPGLLALVCAAFVTQHLDVRAARVYARRVPDERGEAVDFFWVRVVGAEAPSVVTDARVQLVEETLERFLGRADLQDDSRDSQSEVKLKAPTARPPAFRPSQRSPSVHFDSRSLAEGSSVLVLEAPDTPRLLLAITRALAAEGVDIIASDVRTVDGWAHDRFTLEEAGSSLGATTRECVLAAVQQVMQHAPSGLSASSG